MRAYWLSLLVFAWPGHATAEEPGTDRLPPQAHCLDARATTGVYQSDDLTLIVNSHKGAFLLGLAQACPQLTGSSQLSLLGPGGWICGSDMDRVRTADQRCAIATSTPINAREFAQLAKQSQQYRTASLEAVQVKGKAGINRQDRYRRGFVGTTDYCFDPAQMRSWNETPEGLHVQVSPRRNGGNSTYAVELSGSCPMLSSSPAVRFQSGMGLGVICGNAGDRVVVLRDVFTDQTGVALRHAGSFMTADTSAFANIATAVTGRCGIAAVYPVSR